MDGIDKLQNNIIVVGTTNRLNSIDPAFLRSGRFDAIIEIPAPKTLKDTESILMVYLSKLKQNNKLSPKVSIEEIAQKMFTKGYTGAKIEGMIKVATLYAIERCKKDILIEKEDLDKAFRYIDKKGENKDYLHIYV
jgi:ATP-dependent 26S proteasome regulatory subunit